MPGFIVRQDAEQKWSNIGSVHEYPMYIFAAVPLRSSRTGGCPVQLPPVARVISNQIASKILALLPLLPLSNLVSNSHPLADGMAQLC